MGAKLAAKVHAALSTCTSIRCYTKVTCREKSRQRRDVVAWAQDIVTKQCTAIAAATSVTPTSFASQLLMVVIYGRKFHVLICYDDRPRGLIDTLYRATEETPEQQADASPEGADARPIYQVHDRGGSIIVIRNARLDKYIKTKYSGLQDCDRTNLPYFQDEDYPTVHINGERIEDTVKYWTENPLTFIPEPEGRWPDSGQDLSGRENGDTIGCGY